MPDRYGNPDPEFDDRPPGPGPNGCKQGGACTGGGWVEVLPAYATRLHPDPPAPELGASHEVLVVHAAACRDAALARAAAANSCYPCKSCNTRAFFRWAAGCLAPGHVASECSRCIELGDVPTRRRGAA